MNAYAIAFAFIVVDYITGLCKAGATTADYDEDYFYADNHQAERVLSRGGHEQLPRLPLLRFGAGGTGQLTDNHNKNREENCTHENLCYRIRIYRGGLFHRAV